VSRPLVRQVRLGSTALAAAVQAPCCVLLLRRGSGVRPPIVVTYDGSPAARQALRIATHLARENGNYLAVLILADTADGEYQLQAQTADWLRRQGLLIRYRRLAEASVAALTQAMLSEGKGVLVLNSAILPPAELQELLDEVDFPVLLVR
jgi:nucleotide-binding universal stress UspA family protein